MSFLEVLTFFTGARPPQINFRFLSPTVWEMLAISNYFPTSSFVAYAEPGNTLVP
jgi:hypothetical protein